MSIYDKSSLVLIPSGTKTSKVYSQKPTNGDGDFDFTRSTAATRVNADGNIEKETSNLLLQSNGFSTSPFTTSNTSVTSGQSGYDGTTDAWSLISNGTNGFENVHQIISFSGVYTISVYAKQGSNNYLTIRTLGDDLRVQFKLDDGTHSTAYGSPVDTFMEDAGSGWYRCGFTANFSSATYVLFYPQIIGITTAGNILIQDAQVEQGLVARDVLTTTTTALYGGITDNVPRLDYTDSSCPALLLEPQRTNVLTNSEYVGGMTLQNISATANATTSPEGVGNAYEVEPTGTGFKTIGNFVSVTANLTYTISFFYKNVDHKNIGFYDNNTSGSEIQINVQDNTFTLGSNVINGNVEDYGNGWYRAYATFAASSGTLANYLIFRNDSNSGSYTATGSSIYVYGFQVESGSYKTSYIPTYGTSVTRNVDSCLKTGISSLIGQSNGTLFVEVGVFPKETNGRIFGISDGSTNKYIIIIKNSTNTDFAVYVTNNGGQVTYQGAGSLNDNSKIAVGYANNDYVIYVNGTQVHTDTSASVPTCSNIYVGQRENGSGTYVAGGSVKQALLFKTRLTNAELATLTTI